MWRVITLFVLMTTACGRLGFDAVPALVDGPTGDGSIPLPTHELYIKASNTEASDNFGSAIAVSEDGAVVAIGALNEDGGIAGVGGNEADNSVFGSGAVYIYVRSGSTYVKQAYLKASNPGINDQFGFNLALSADGHTLAVTSPLEASVTTGIDGNQADNTAAAAGAVYVFGESGGVWAQQAYVKATNTNQSDSFGFALALSRDGNTLAIGARQEDSGFITNQLDNSAFNSGAVYTFIRTGSTWGSQAYLKPDLINANNEFGYSLALSDSGDTLVIGAPFEASKATGVGGDATDQSASSAGAAYVFERVGAAWSQHAYIKASNTEAGDDFGWDVAVSGDGNTLASSSYSEASAATGINGNQASNGAVSSGAAYVFVRAGASWVQEAYVKAPNTDANDQFGDKLGLTRDGNELVISAPNEASAATAIDGTQTDNSAVGSGAGYVFVRSSGQWAFRSYLKASNAEANDSFGYSISVGETSGTIAVGAYTEDSAATGVDGVQSDNAANASGAAYVFE